MLNYQIERENDVPCGKKDCPYYSIHCEQNCEGETIIGDPAPVSCRNYVPSGDGGEVEGAKVVDENKKRLHAHYPCIVDPFREMVFDFSKGKLVKYRGQWPVFGFVCPECDIACGNLKHWLVDGRDMCEECALKYLQTGTEKAGKGKESR